MPIAIAITNFIIWNTGINDNSFSIVNPAQDEAPEGIPKYNDARYPNKKYKIGQMEFATKSATYYSTNSTYYIPNGPHKCSVV